MKRCHKNLENIYVGNYASAWENKSCPSKKYIKYTDMDSRAYTAVKYFMRMQKLPLNQKIPKYITEFIDEYEVMRLLEG